MHIYARVLSYRLVPRARANNHNNTHNTNTNSHNDNSNNKINDYNNDDHNDKHADWFLEPGRPFEAQRAHGGRAGRPAIIYIYIYIYTHE